MRVKTFFVVVFIFAFSVMAAADKVIPLTDLNKPDTLGVYNDQIYIVEDFNVYIYSLKDGKLIKKIGKKGQGPKEMVSPPFWGMQVLFKPDKFYVMSQGKVTFFSFRGEYIEEKKHAAFFGLSPFFPIKEKYVGLGFKQKDGKNFLSINLFDKDLKKIKEVISYQLEGSQTRQKVLNFSAAFQTYKGQLFVAHPKNFGVDVFDDTGKKLYSFTHDHKRVKFTDQHRENVWSWAKTHPVLKAGIDNLKTLWQFPQILPAIRIIYADSNKLYVQFLI